MGKRKLVCFPYRYTSMGARTETIPLIVKNGKVERLQPLFTRRSKSGNHGEDCYTKGYLAAADVYVYVEISNSGNHYCSIEVKREFSEKELVNVAEWLVEHEHICDMLAEKLIDLGLSEEKLVELVRR